MTRLPAPEPEALIHSQELTEQIRQEISRRDGWISFADYMAFALYHPTLGYYTGGSRKLGAAGDFTTAPEISPIFGQCVARTVAAVLSETHGDVLEIGAGSGRLAADLLLTLQDLNQLPDRYLILDVSPELQDRQRTTILNTAPALVDRVEWVTQIPAGFTGCMVGNELLDAMPFHIIETDENQKILERGVAWQEDQFIWQARPLAAGNLQDQVSALFLPPNYRSEVQLSAQGFIRTAAEQLTHGVLLLIDYGFDESQYYHPQRDQGTLMCHYRHHSLDDPFFLPGLQDITCHIDFSAIYNVANQCGLSLEGYTNQASYLLDADLAECLSRQESTSATERAKHAAAVNKLFSPAEMGELFKVIGFSRGLSGPRLPGFRQSDLSGSL